MSLLEGVDPPPVPHQGSLSPYPELCDGGNPDFCLCGFSRTEETSEERGSLSLLDKCQLAVSVFRSAPEPLGLSSLPTTPSPISGSSSLKALLGAKTVDEDVLYKTPTGR